MRLERFYPKERIASAYEIPYEKFREYGYRGIIFDIDNTLVPHGAPADGRAAALFKRLHGLGFATCLLSNNKEPRVKSFAEQVKSPYLYKGGGLGAALFQGQGLRVELWSAWALGRGKRFL